MNFLAHVFLSGDDHELLVGNFMGDFVKGKKYEEYPAKISRGVLLHREIDYFTDNHAAVEKSKARLRPNFGHYAPVIVDIFYDHFLNRNWEMYSDVNLESYIQQVYATIDRYYDVLPPRLAAIFPNIKQFNWLLGYGMIEGVERSLAGMSRRSKFNPRLERATTELVDHYEAFNEDFNRFFPDVITFAKGFYL